MGQKTDSPPPPAAHVGSSVARNVPEPGRLPGAPALVGSDGYNTGSVFSIGKLNASYVAPGSKFPVSQIEAKRKDLPLLKTVCPVAIPIESLEDAPLLVEAVDTAAKGLIELGKSTVAEKLNYDAAVDAMARIGEADGIATVVIASPVTKAALLKAIDGGKMDTIPPMIEVSSCPANTVLVADGDMVASVISKKVTVKSSASIPEYCEKDLVGISALARISGPAIADPAYVQVLTLKKAA